ncbi:hypothetical protein [Rhizobium ruizarguesonis]|uniref:Uncharacterized protein n=1 Tax=Rhizobium ruizarguesonis TaxID=2081791 RepID=A0AAE8QCV5_9HYPH|nr:hypothetical protein [Rhizobium ruizarguesonis]TBE49308.1 hypothetical protein ELH06_09115 [Rhizobium ruizarguesonis]TBF18452.1 hypothetical protein ELG94_08800 [Rhizobium ruizarguesonis]
MFQAGTFASAFGNLAIRSCDADGGNLLALRHPGGLGGLTPGNISDGIDTIIGRAAPIIKFLQQLAGPLDGPRPNPHRIVFK